MEENTKPFLSYDEQIRLLIQRNLNIDDVEKAKRILATVNYYRLINAYSLGLFSTDKNGQPRYYDNVSFYQIYDLYLFDAELRHIVSEPIEDFELLFRTKLAYFLGEKYGALGYLNPANFEKVSYHNEFINILNAEKEHQNNSPILKHHQQKYNGNMPIWVAVEVLSFGTVAKLYSNLCTEDRKQITKELSYSIPEFYLSSWLRTFVEVRNICAHYGRLYNKPLTSPPKLFKGCSTFDNKYIFAVFYLLKRFESTEEWLKVYKRLCESIENHTYVELNRVGFPKNWEQILKPI